MCKRVIRMHIFSVMEACDLLVLDTDLNEDSIPFEITALSKHRVKSILNRRLGRNIFSSLT